MKLHLGCGKKKFPGYINVDLAKFEHIDYCNPIHDLSFAQNNSVDEIYSSHSLEYYSYQDCERLVIPEWRRVLKSTGKIYLGVPNFEALVDIYKATQNIDFIIGPLYGRMPCNEDYIYHKCTYDFKKLKEIFLNNGFSSVEKWDWKNHPTSEIDDHTKAYFPHMNQKGRLISLNVEITK